MSRRGIYMRHESSEHIDRQNDVERRFGDTRIEISDRFDVEIGNKCDEDNENNFAVRVMKMNIINEK